MSSSTIQIEREKKTVGISRIGQRRQMVIPKTVFEELELETGDFLEITGEGAGRFTVKRKKLVDADDALTLVEAKKVRHGLKQMREGKIKPWDEVNPVKKDSTKH